MSSDEKFSELHKDELAKSEFEAERAKAHYENLMKKSYLDPVSASKNMDEYRSKNGNKALYEKLAGNARNTAFGPRPGSLRTGDGYKAGASERRQESHIARQGLSQAVKDLHESRERYAAVQQASQTIEERNALKREELRQQREIAREQEAKDREERQKSSSTPEKPDRGRDDDLER